jgi:DNA modification methylase
MDRLVIEYRSTAELIPYANNPRNNEQAIEKVAASIKEFGFRNPVIIDQDNIIVAGHTRLLAAESLGITEVPTLKVTDLTPEQLKAFRIADNKVAEFSEWDEELLAQELEELKLSDFDISSIGFEASELQDLLSDIEADEPGDSEAVDDDFDFTELEQDEYVPFTKKGQVWQLGPHRLMCGDSVKSEDVSKLMDGEKVDLIVTDPPYNVDYVGKTKDALKIKNDKMDDNSFYNFLYDVYSMFYDYAKDGAGIYVFHADSEGMNFRKAMVDAGFKLAQCCIWVKQTLVMGRQDYHWKHEPILYGWKPTGPHHWHSDRKQTTVWNFDRPTRSEFHPTMKPIPLISYPITNSSKKGDKVLDLFGGSGSTLIACDQIGRINYSMELDERYCDVIINRYIALKGSSEDVFLITDDGEKVPYASIVNED